MEGAERVALPGGHGYVRRRHDVSDGPRRAAAHYRWPQADLAKQPRYSLSGDDAIMSQHATFVRTAVQPQAAERLEVTTFPTPTRGIIQSENETFTQPGAAVVMDNWKPTMKGASLRGGCVT